MAGKRQQFGYQLHESTRRNLCRLAFVTFGVLPLIACSVFAAAQFFPNYQRWRAEQVGQRLAIGLGLGVEVAAVESKSPTFYVLHGVKLVHPESGAVIARVKQVDVRSRAGKQLVRLTEPELDGRQLATTWRIIHDWFLCRPQRYSHMSVFDIDELIIRQAEGVDTISDVAVKMLPSDEALLLEIGFQLADKDTQTEPAPSQLIIRRDHREHQLMTDIQLRANSPLSCALIYGLIPKVQQLGRNATFNGVLDFHMRDTSWEAAMTDVSFQRVDFGKISENSGAGISGEGRIDLKQAVVTDHQVKYANGSIRLGAGRISSSLLLAIGVHMDVEVRETNPVSVHAFDEAGVHLCIQPEGVQIAGGLGPEFDLLFTDSLGGLARRSAAKWHEPIALANIIETLNASNFLDGSRSLSVAARSAMRWLPTEEVIQRTASSSALLPSINPAEASSSNESQINASGQSGSEGQAIEDSSPSILR